MYNIDDDIWLFEYNMFILQCILLLGVIYYIHLQYVNNTNKERKSKSQQGGMIEQTPQLQSKTTVETLTYGNEPYQYINQPEPYTSLTKNYLEARDNTNLFSVNYPSYPTHTMENSNSKDDIYYRDVLKGIVERTPLSDTFFSGSNIQYIKEQIAKQVKEQSGLHITPQSQSSSELVTIMRHTFLQNSTNLTGESSIQPQVNELNKKVFLEVVPMVISNAKMHLTYQRDAGGQPVPMERPQSTTITGTRTNQGTSKLFI